MLSFWEKESLISYDYAIIGSGIVGLSTAISVKEKQPAASVVILEKGILPSGASTKNAGFACFGSLSELCADIDKIGKEATLELVKFRKEGLDKLRQRLGDDALDYQNLGGHELIREKQADYIDRLDELNHLLKPLFGKSVFTEKKELIETFSFNSNSIKSLIFNPFESQIHTGKMMASLTQMALKLGVTILTGSDVVDISDMGSHVEIGLRNSIGKGDLLFKAKKTAICTNAFSQQFLNDESIYPGRGSVLVTKPIQGLKFKGTFHIDQGFYYFRNVEDRVLLGGGRNLALDEETTTEFGINPIIQSELERLLIEVILPSTPHQIDYYWSGIMAFGAQLHPIVKMHSSRIALGVRLSGMGVAIGSHIGDKVAHLLI